MNIRGGPALGLIPKAKTAGMMASAAIMAATVSKKAVRMDAFGMSSDLDRYVPYTIIPDPVMDNEKNAWPMAMTQVSTLSKSLQSGVNRNLYPSTAPGRNATRIARTANRTKKEGIRTLLIFSIPFVAPNIRMAAAMTITSTCQGTLPKFPVAWLK